MIFVNWKMRNKDKILDGTTGIVGIAICVFFGACVLFTLFPMAYYPTEVMNTFEACDWCENNASEYFEHCPHCFDGMTCDACVDYYRNHFNLTQEAFPCYCWNDAESAPNKIEWLFMEYG